MILDSSLDPYLLFIMLAHAPQCSVLIDLFNFRDKLAPVKLNRYKDDILFFLFYTNVGDVLQLAAAAELHNRDWRYHKVIKTVLLRCILQVFLAILYLPS